MVEKQYWLLLEKSVETRVSQSNDNYNDDTGKTYNYDSLVPNHKNVSPFDVVIFRKEQDIIGFGFVSKIEQKPLVKLLKRCPSCTTTDIRERKKTVLKFRCGKCSTEFDDPISDSKEVISYTVHIGGFAPFDNPPMVVEVKGCGFTEKSKSSQNAIIALDPIKINKVLRGLSQMDSSLTSDMLKNEITEEEYSALLKKLFELERTDTEGLQWQRAEQRYLKKLLFGKNTISSCACCGQEFPVSFLVTAHIKKRSLCELEERKDLNVVMPMCKFGCDEMFEQGLVSVYEGLFVDMENTRVTSTVQLHVNKVKGNKCDYYNEKSKQYFVWNYKKNKILN